MPVQQTQTPFEVQSPTAIPQPGFVTPTPIPLLPVQIPPPPTQIPQPPLAVETTSMVGPPVASPPLPTPLPLPLLASGPAPLPLPPPLPQLGGPGALPFPALLGLPITSLSLDAPLPNAPKITVTASPVEDTLSEKEQSELLNELS